MRPSTPRSRARVHPTPQPAVVGPASQNSLTSSGEGSDHGGGSRTAGRPQPQPQPQPPLVPSAVAAGASASQNKDKDEDETGRSLSVGTPSSAYVDNSVRTSLYTWYTFVPRNLYEQFRRLANVFFLAVAVLQQIPGVSPTGRYTTILPLGLVLLVTAIKAAIEDWRRHRSDAVTNGTLTRALRSPEPGAPREWLSVPWADLCVGDIVRVIDNETFPADLVLLASVNGDGTAYVETSNLDGETNLKQRRALGSTTHLDSVAELTGFVDSGPRIEFEDASPAIYSFSGNLHWDAESIEPLAPAQILLRGCQLRNTTYVHGVVIYAGHDSKLMQNAADRIAKISNVERVTNFQIILMFFVEITLAALAALGSGLWIAAASSSSSNHTYLQLGNVDPPMYAFANFFTFFILFNNLIPISLYVSMELVKFGQAYLISQDIDMYHAESDTPAVALTSDLNEELGQIEYVFSDKTGTLTENVMEFAGISVGGVMYGRLPQSADLDLATKLTDLDAFRHRAAKNLTGSDSPELDALHVMALCHTVLPALSSASGDLVMSNSPSVARLSPLGEASSVVNQDAIDLVQYQASSPDEAALVSAARNLGCALIDRDPSTLKAAYHFGGAVGACVSFELLHVLEFTSARKRMSVIVRTPQDEIVLLIKGADAVILPVLTVESRSSPSTRAALEHIETFAASGLRTLVCAKRVIDPLVYSHWRDTLYTPAAKALENRGEKLADAAAAIETSLTFVAVTAIEDKLQAGVADAISMLRKADINVWVLTGDKQGTAINIATACNLITADMDILVVNEDDPAATRAHLDELVRFVDPEPDTDDAAEPHVSPTLVIRSPSSQSLLAPHAFAFVIDGHTLSIALASPHLADLFYRVAIQCRAVVVCRATPLQKAQVVNLVRERKSSGSRSNRALTLAIGDGSNDVSMIQSAHVGVGISGREGLQAAKAADYAIAQFRFLAVLLLKHGARSYQRISTLILYSFYKNIALYIIQLWFGLFNGLSGQSLFERWSISTFNVFFSSLPILVYGLYNSEYSAQAVLLFPELYPHVKFSTRIYWSWVLNAIIHSIIIFFTGYFAFHALSGWGENGQNAGLVSFGFVIYSVVVITVNLKLALVTHSMSALQLATYLISVFAWFFFVLIYPLTSINSEAEGVGFFVLASPLAWFFTILVPVATILPDFTLMYVLRTFNPRPRDIVREIDSLGIEAVMTQATHAARPTHAAHPTPGNPAAP